MAYIEKMKNGKYRIRKMIKGKRYSCYLDHKPKQTEAEMILMRMADSDSEPAGRLLFETAARRYIDSRSNILSPATVREYERTLKSIPVIFKTTPISDFDSDRVQKYINEYSTGRSPKTARNMYGFISGVLKKERPTLTLNVQLPQKIKKEFFVPEDDDVKKILSAIEGSEFEIPILLASFGLRRSEICALTLDDISGCDIRINKALVMDSEKNWVIKTTKTEQSSRIVTVPQFVIDKIRQKGYIYKGHPGSISRYLKNAEKNLGVKSFSLHKLRHYFASTANALGIPETYILEMGGWHTSDVMRKVYTHSQKSAAERNRQIYVNHMGEITGKTLGKF